MILKFGSLDDLLAKMMEPEWGEEFPMPPTAAVGCQEWHKLLAEWDVANTAAEAASAKLKAHRANIAAMIIAELPEAAGQSFDWNPTTKTMRFAKPRAEAPKPPEWVNELKGDHGPH